MDRKKLVEILIAHQRRDIGSCLCGWDKLGHSHAEHVADEILSQLGVLFYG
jgi:hypothetical protein